jgi:hypothetical protein
LNEVIPKRRTRPSKSNRNIDDEDDDKEYSDGDNYQDNFKDKENKSEVINEKKAPPPSTAPPRRASDALAEVSAKKTPSIDELLTKRLVFI